MNQTLAPIAPLFVPGSRPDRFAKAIKNGSGDIIIDLEDAVAENAKASAREAIHEFLSTLVPRAERDFNLSIRINAPVTQHYPEDVALIHEFSDRIDYVVLPMVEDPQQITEVFHAAAEGNHRPPMVAQIETAQGVLNAPAIATAKGLLTLAFGAADYANELNISTSGTVQFLFARSAVVNACAASGLTAPLDSPHFDITDPEGMAHSVAHARELGFGGKFCIHPQQTSPVLQAFAPSDAEVQKAREISEAFETAQNEGVSSVKLPNGTFIDYPVYHRAQKILTKAR